MKKTTPQPILTLKEAGRKLRLCETTMQNLLRDGTIPGTKLGRQWRILDESVEAILRGRHVQPHGTTETRPAA